MKTNDILLNSSFYLIKKEEFDNIEVQKVISKLHISKAVDSFHPERRKEFLLGRYCAYQAYKELRGEELLNLPVGTDRSALWPAAVVGTISHNQKFICSAVANREKLDGLGVDVEFLGRTKLELARYIRVESDLLEHPLFDENELLTFIFSAKEALYKALAPKVKMFFGFEYASVLEINESQNTFTIELIKDLNDEFNLLGRHLFQGRFAIVEDSLFTAIEIAP